MRVGVHCSVRKGFVGAIQEAAELGCDTLQMFTQSPRGWKTRVYLDEEFAAFRQEREKCGLHPVLVHAPYLPNLCTSNARLYHLSLTSLLADLERCEKLGAEYLVIHPGAYSPDEDFPAGLSRLHAALNKAFEAVPGKAMVLIENVAGGGRRVGSKASEIAAILRGVKEERRIGVCFDTCHALAAGYDISHRVGVEETWREFQREVGLERIRAFHVNDSKGGLGSNRDLHEHIGKGNIGEAGFKHLFSHDAFLSHPLILETPKDPAPAADKENLRRLRALLAKDVAFK